MEQRERNHLIVIAGLPGTGKSILSKKIAAKLNNYTLIDQNDLRRQSGMRTVAIGI